MPPKSPKSPRLQRFSATKSSSYGESDETFITARRVSLSVRLEGSPPGPEGMFVTVFNGQIVLDGKWRTDAEYETEALPLDLKEPYHQLLVSQKPLVFLFRVPGGKGSKDPDPLISPDNRAGAAVDLFPLLIGEEEIFIRVPLLYISSGELSECIVNAQILANEPSENAITTVPLVMTMISAHCLPIAKDGTVYIGAISLDRVLEPATVNFGMSLSFPVADKTVWATISNAGQAANTAFSVPDEDKFIPEDLSPKNKKDCRSFYWNAMNRVCVDPNLLRERLSSPLVLEIAGVPRTGKVDVRGRYMGFVDAGVLLQPGQHGVTVCTKLLFYNEIAYPENVGALLELPPTSAKISARDTDLITDEFEHSAYIVLRFDLWEPLVPKTKIAALFENIGLMCPEGPVAPTDDLDVDPPSEDPVIDVRKIRKESGALAVHKELSGLACRGAVPMNQGIKRTAANRLLMRVRSMLKQFPPGDCSYIDWQDTVTAQHAASRRAVTSSFAPQPPPFRQSVRIAAARCRMAGDNSIANAYTEANVKFSAGTNPRAVLCKALRCLEESSEWDAKKYILKGLNAHPRNRFLLWTFGGQEFDKGVDASEMAAAALRIAVKGDYSDGTANAIGWAALHTLHHFNENPYGAFVAARKMRKSYELPKEWKKFLQRWTDASGEEEVFWIPAAISSWNPLLIAAAFFLCLRCYTFTENMLLCVEKGCATNGSRFGMKTKLAPDISYLRSASLILQRQFDKALDITTIGIKKLGPNPMLSQMRATCLISARGWDGDCAIALEYAEKSGAESCPALLLRAALGGINTDPEGALQRAARAHKIAPCGSSALIIARIYAKINEPGLAKRWAAAAVKSEPMLADGWAVLALLAMQDRNVEKARTMLRTAKQLGPVCSEIEEELKKTIDIVQLEGLPESLVKNLCLCEYY